MGAQSTLFGPVKYSILPELLKNNEVLAGNSYFEMGTYVAILVGTIIGGIIVTFGGEEQLPLIGLILTIASIGVLASTKNIYLPPSNPNLKFQLNPISPSINILKLTFKKKDVFLSIIGISWFWFLGAMIITVLPPLTKEFFHGTESVVTFFLATFSIGIGIGSIMCERLSGERIDLGLVVVGAYAMSIFLFDLSLIDPITLSEGASLSITNILSSFSGIRLVFDMFMFALFAGFYSVPLYTYMQLHSGLGERSQIVAGNNILNALFMVVASILLIVLFSFGYSIGNAFLIFSIINLILAYFTYKLCSHEFLRLLCSTAAKTFYRFSITGKEKVPMTGPFVVVCNHVTFIDWLFICSSTKRPIRFVMHRDFLKIPFARWFFEGSNLITIASTMECKKTHTNAFDEIKKALENNEAICIFPEGNITKTSEVNTFRKGIEKIIKSSPVPVVPMRLGGLWPTFFSKNRKTSSLKHLLNPFCKITLTIGDSLPAEEVSASKLEEIVKNL